MGATSDKGFEQYQEMFRRAYSKSSEREIGEGFMRGEAAAASGVDGMIIHPTGEAPPPLRDDDIRLSASYGEQSFKGRVAASYYSKLVDIWPGFVRDMRKRGLGQDVITDDARHDAREFIFSMIVENRQWDPTIGTRPPRNALLNSRQDVITDDARHDAREFIFSMIVENRQWDPTIGTRPPRNALLNSRPSVESSD
jgi:hypothetical protein